MKRSGQTYDRVKNSLLYVQTDGKCVTSEEYLQNAGNPEKKNIYYTTDKALQAQYIELYQQQNIAVVELNHQLDTQFVSTLENYENDAGIHFLRVDSATDVLKNEEGEDLEKDQKKKLTDLFRKVSKDEKLEVIFESMKDASVPAMLVLSEESRRMEDMMRMYGSMGLGSSFPLEYKLHVNTSSELTKKLAGLVKEDKDKAEKMGAYLYRLSVLAQRKLSADELKEFLSSSFDLLKDF